MKKLLGHILSIVFVLGACTIAKAQDNSFKSMDESLKQYESLCMMCLDLRVRIKQGENISKSEAEVFISRFLALNKELKALENDMSEDQKRRFVAIGQWFTTGEKPVVMRHERLADIEDDTFLCHLQQDLQMKLEIPEVTEMRTGSRDLSVLAIVAAPDMSYGFMAGYRWPRWGVYASFKSNYVFGDTSYSCFSDGFLPNGGRFWSCGQDRKSNLVATMGGMYRVNKWLNAYLGAGYGKRTLAWKDVDGVWAEVSDWSHRGAALETGVMFSWNRFVASVGVTTISFRTCSLNIGVGYSFEL